MKPPRWTADEWAAMNLLLQARAGGSCERCGKECGPAERHHRKRKREGGDSLANVVMFGRPCHTYVHAHPVEARKYGWIVSAYADPSTIPMLWHMHEWVTFDEDGTKHPLGEELEDAHAREGAPHRGSDSGAP